MRSTETEIAIIQERLKDLEKLELELDTLKTAYQTDRIEVQNLLRLITSLKNLLTILATTIIGSIATNLLSRYN